jgi:hypothetical protein
MPEHGADRPDHAERLAQNADVLKSAWERTIDEMKAMAAELEADGWETTYVGAGHTAPESPRAEPEGRFGLTYVIPDNYADEFSAAFQAGGYEEYEVFRNESGGNVFQVTVMYDEETKQAILLAGSYELLHANPLIATAMKTGEMYTHVQLLDGSHLGSFRHENWEAFFPDADQRLQQVTEEMEKAMDAVEGEADPWVVQQMAGEKPVPENTRLNEVDPEDIEESELPESDATTDEE